MNYLNDLSASELNAAIDDTNFPKNNNNENGKKMENGDGGNGSIRTFKNSSFKRDIPSPLVGGVFSENYSDIPSTPKTPRTTTTPGKFYNLLFIFSV